MKNKLSDLNDHLFAQLERLSDETVKGDELKEEIERSRAVTGISQRITENARLTLDAVQIAIDYPQMQKYIPMLKNVDQ